MKRWTGRASPAGSATSGNNAGSIQIQGQPCRPFSGTQELEQARQGYICLADLLLTKEGTLRKSVNVTLGFPKESPEKSCASFKCLITCALFLEWKNASTQCARFRLPATPKRIGRLCAPASPYCAMLSLSCASRSLKRGRWIFRKSPR